MRCPIFDITAFRWLIRIGITAIGIILLSAVINVEGGCAKEKTLDTQHIDLPDPTPNSGTTLEKALNGRRSVRDFSDKPLALENIAQLLWAAQGITHSRGFRTAPSAGALYPLEIYAVIGDGAKTDAGIYHYRPKTHQIKPVAEGDQRKALCRAGLNQSAICNAPLSIVMTGVFERTTGKYGKRGMQYVFMEAGHAAQNVLLQAESIGLGAVPIGAFDNKAVSRVLHLSESETPLYILCIGHSTTD